MLKPCLFCFEEVKQSIYKKPVPCQCKLIGHAKCFERWFKERNQIECPICHMVTIQNPLHQQALIQIVYINVRPIEFQLLRRRKIVCASIFILFLVTSTVVSAFFLYRTKYKD